MTDAQDGDMPTGFDSRRTGDAPGVGRRTLTAIAWNFGASPLQMVVLFLRSVALARLLPVALFGMFAWATSVVYVSSLLAGFGMGYAYLNRVTETEDERTAADVFFTLKLAASAVWAGAMIALSLRFAEGDLRTLLVGLTLVQAANVFVDTPRLVLTRRVVHRRLVVVDTVVVIAASLVAVLLAWRGSTVWALLGSEVVVVVLTSGALLLWRPAWRPRLRWDSYIVRYYLRFARASLPTSLLMRGIENIDNLWTGAVLGDYALGIYSRAYRFATYPRTLIAMPTSKVVRGTFAELKNDVVGLSRAFVAVNGSLVRSGFLLAGVLVIVAPEFVLLLLGEKWLPMVRPFQLLVVFALVDPIRVSLTDLLLGIGEQGIVLRSYAMQLVVLSCGLLVLGRAFGVTGVAMAVDTMAVFATAHLLWRARSFVRFSMRALWLPPALAMASGAAATAVALRLPIQSESPVMTGGLKGISFALAFALVLAVMERERVWTAIDRARRIWSS